MRSAHPTFPLRHRLRALGLLALTLLGTAACHRAQPAELTTRPHEGYVAVPGGNVYYQVVGEGPGTPLLLVHGGPGGSTCGYAELKALADERPVIFYDQLGGGRSEQPSDTTLWRLERFVEELDAVREALDLEEVHILGHSWGAALAAEYVLTHGTEGVRSLILSGPLLSTPQWVEDAAFLRAQLPDTLQRIMATHEAAGTMEHPEYLAAVDSFYARHVMRLNPRPKYPECEGMQRGGRNVYQYMWGPSEFYPTGTLLTYDRMDRLDELALPVLLMGGEYDEARPETLREYGALMPDARVVTIEDASHGTMVEQPEAAVRALREFLREVESR